jgi:cation diffusion facilitator CzcD-associated flavoprotein CzcO
MHSINFKSAKHFAGKRVVVIGACTSSHDICADCVRNDVDVTMVQRNPTYVMSSKEGLRVALPGETLPTP